MSLSQCLLIITLVHCVKCNTYMGEKFPSKYLAPDEHIPTLEDANNYFKSLNRIVRYFAHEYFEHNDTSIDRALGAFYVTAILKRTMDDNADKMESTQIEALKNTTWLTEQHIWLYTYEKKMLPAVSDVDHVEYQISSLMRDDTPQAYSMGNFTRNRLKKWLLSSEKINHLNMDLDTASLPKEKFIELTNGWHTYNIDLADLDDCMAQAGLNPEPIDVTKMKRCRLEARCKTMITRSPAAAYSLSHRIMTLLMYRHIRRCYIYSDAEDERLMEKLCSFMYREAVYIARRGYFARDVFMEHIVLCAFLGYEEFYRHAWLKKISSWVDEEGCVEENHNFQINKTKMTVEYYEPKGEEMVERLKLGAKRNLANECQRRPMVLAMVALAHAVRHAVHYVSKSK